MPIIAISAELIKSASDFFPEQITVIRLALFKIYSQSSHENHILTTISDDY
jgi:hypothetical protein